MKIEVLLRAGTTDLEKPVLTGSTCLTYRTVFASVSLSPMNLVLIVSIVQKSMA